MYAQEKSYITSKEDTRPRKVVTTDGEVDDVNSCVLLYPANLQSRKY